MPRVKQSVAKAPVSNEEHRDRIVRVLYERHSKARGPGKIPIGIRDLQRELKTRFGMTQQDVSANLDYLVQVGWVREAVKERSFKTPGGMELSQEQVRYKISDVGINHLEAGTMFKKPAAVSQVNITNVKGVTVVGDGNVVNTQFTSLASALDVLDRGIGESRRLTDDQKVDAAGDLGTIRSQIAKPNPNRGVVKAAWQSLEAIATLAGVTDAVLRAKELLGPLLGGG